MKVILTEKVKTLGNVGEMVNVSPGYARNFLFPQNVAVLADEANKKFLENQQRQLAKKVAEERAAAETLKNQIENTQLSFMKKVGGNGRLFGTITTSEISKELAKKDMDVEKRIIHIETAIKTLGDFEVKVKLFSDIEATLKVKVEIDQNQAKEMKEKQALAEQRAKAKKEAAAKKAEQGESEEASAETAEAENTDTEKTEDNA